MGCDSEKLNQQSSRCVPRKEIVYLSMIFVWQTVKTKEKAYIYVNEDSKGFFFYCKWADHSYSYVSPTSEPEKMLLPPPLLHL